MGLIQKMSYDTNFSPLEKEIINYIFQNSDQVIKMTIAQLAEKTYASNASIIRLCKKLGQKGFREFKVAYAQELEKRKRDTVYVDYNYPFHMLESPTEVSHDIAVLTKSTIDACYKEIDAKLLYSISQQILKSKHVYIYAIGDAEIRAESFKNKMLKIGKHFINATDRGEEVVVSSYANKDDCAIFITYSSTNQKYIRNAKILKLRGTPIVTITANPNSFLKKYSDYFVCIPNLEDPINSIATFYSQISFEYVLNIIYSLVYLIHYEKNQNEKQRVDQIRTVTG